MIVVIMFIVIILVIIFVVITRAPLSQQSTAHIPTRPLSDRLHPDSTPIKEKPPYTTHHTPHNV